MWTKGEIKTLGQVVKYWVKHYEEGSSFGLDGGRISTSMLSCKRNACFPLILR